MKCKYQIIVNYYPNNWRQLIANICYANDVDEAIFIAETLFEHFEVCRVVIFDNAKLIKEWTEDDR